MSNSSPKVNTLILDAGPLITQSAGQLQNLAENFYTTPGVFNELRDERVRSQLPIWAERLQVRQPKKESINAVSNFAKLTGDYAVLSVNDVHLIALTYEIECELNHGNWRLRESPGQKRRFERGRESEKEKEKRNEKEEEDRKDDEEKVGVAADKESNPPQKQDADDGWTIVKDKSLHADSDPLFLPVKPRRRGGKRHKKKESSKLLDNQEKVPEKKKEQTVAQPDPSSLKNPEDLNADYSEDDDDGEWITPENLYETMLKDNNESMEKDKTSLTKVKAALATGDFAIQNVALQIGLDLMNTMSGMRIKRVRNYMYRCYACFTLTPMPKNGVPRHFCPNCGGATVTRCAVSVNAGTGEVTPFLKKNFEWHSKGNVYSMPSPLSKNAAKRYGRKGFQHRGNPNIDDIYLREDQKEYQQALKDAEWQRRQTEKAMEDFVGGGSADNIVSPFLAGGGSRAVRINVGRGKNANAPRRQRK
ncbi:DEKNAAC100471 [Brettanomyces naardenensis]|uniref:20S-pre-rRNA D-site endonuclease NOB1 n=1 Tax=Brettanomyces naardenensis TaxID=13370 RepID=A0A448YGA3_BRENA|nr:DEKNAAC100471 [Brettanomyces naardenensis]